MMLAERGRIMGKFSNGLRDANVRKKTTGEERRGPGRV